ncbi:MAG: DUF1998 domain-containing protein [Candidatus Dormibacteraeota bacterium]|nr:DUF1998 domain-containing protein [Candidatus Dormibacteraeota bacterium]
MSAVRATENAGPERYFRRVGSVRPSHMLYASGVGAVVDLPGLSVLVRGLDYWDYSAVVANPIIEDRLLRSVRGLLGDQVEGLRTPPWMADEGDDAAGPASRVGVPVIPFPQWLRCTACERLGRIDEGHIWRFENKNPRRPDLARFVHAQCTRRNDPAAVPARFMLACPEGHLDEFPWVTFVHRGGECPNGPGSRLTMHDLTGNVGPNVIVRCECEANRNLVQAVGLRAASRLPRCRGRHPHLGTFEECGRPTEVRTLILGASNQWFGVSLAALHLPSAAQGIAAAVETRWDRLQDVHSLDTLRFALGNVQELAELRAFSEDALWEAIQRHREALASPGPSVPDLRAPEYEVLSDPSSATPDPDFALSERRVPPALTELFEQVVLVDRLREVKAFVGFTRLDAPEWGDARPPGLVRLTFGHPTWVPAAETRGEGLFFRLREERVAAWESRVAGHAHIDALRAAYVRFRRNRGLDGSGWPPLRYWLLHTLSHMLIRQVSLDCGYSSASLTERIYCGTEEEPAAGILVYTAAPDSEGTLGGLVALGEPGRLEALFRGAREHTAWCSSDPLCAEREPAEPEEFVNGAACHACLFLSETTCERGNRFLDRSLVVPVGQDPAIALLET